MMPLWWSRTSCCIADAGQDRLEAIRSALKEITVPLIGSTITPVVVFIPLISHHRVTGVFFPGAGRDIRYRC